jgi:hypothetical protein
MIFPIWFDFYNPPTLFYIALDWGKQEHSKKRFRFFLWWFSTEIKAPFSVSKIWHGPHTQTPFRFTIDSRYLFFPLTVIFFICAMIFEKKIQSDDIGGIHDKLWISFRFNIFSRFRLKRNFSRVYFDFHRYLFIYFLGKGGFYFSRRFLSPSFNLADGIAP